MTLHLTQGWTAAPPGTCGSFRLALHNLGPEALAPVSFCYTSVIRIDDSTIVSGGTVVQIEGSFVQIVPDAGLPAGGIWEVQLRGLVHCPENRTQGVIAAWITLRDGTAVEATVGDLEPLDGAVRGPGTDRPAGHVDVPVALLPWPALIAVCDFQDAPVLYPAARADGAAFVTVAALHRRLFPADPAPISLTPAARGRAVTTTADARLAPGGYRLDFARDIALTHADADGLRHGLIALAQMAHAARTQPAFRFPGSGHIADAPRHGWRGLMLDVVRNFFPVSTHLRLLDIMAWLRMNRLHWHLTDDEGWRMPSRAFPALNTSGAARGPGHAMPSQYGDGPAGQSGFFSAADVARVIGHAARLGVAVMPEVEMPGHAKSLLNAVPGLRDMDEPNAAYRSIQGHTNNALNPGLARTYDVARTLLDEAVDLFSFDVVHVGADEVELTAWSRSPAAVAFAREKGLGGTPEMQACFLRAMQAHLANRGRRIGAWDEAAMGGGVAPDTAVLFAWRTRERIAELIGMGYDVVALPGQAYYLDMVAAPGWDARGMSWAGISTPQNTYEYEATEGLPEGPGRLLGVQAAIWTEYIKDEKALNAMAFPRLAAVAEAAWTPAAQKSWDRFCALSHLVPRL